MGKSGKKGTKGAEGAKTGGPRMPKVECCVSKKKCARCPLRMLKEGTMPEGLTVKRRRVVRLDGSTVTKKQLSREHTGKVA